MTENALTRDLAEVLNRHGIDNKLETPDHILADYVVAVLRAGELAVRARYAWAQLPPDSKEISHD